jgi:hypothetical protein
MSEALRTTRFEECIAALGEAHNETAYGAIVRLVEAGEQVGFNVPDLVRMLNGGMTLEALLDLIELRMAGADIDLAPESRAA